MWRMSLAISLGCPIRLTVWCALKIVPQPLHLSLAPAQPSWDMPVTVVRIMCNPIVMPYFTLSASNKPRTSSSRAVALAVVRRNLQLTLQPSVSAGADFAVPARTPLVIQGSGSDGDGDTLKYVWEQRDLGPAAALSAADDGAIPLFRVYDRDVSAKAVFTFAFQL
jgi:hypothetical protein